MEVVHTSGLCRNCPFGLNALLPTSPASRSLFFFRTLPNPDLPQEAFAPWAGRRAPSLAGTSGSRSWMKLLVPLLDYWSPLGGGSLWAGLCCLRSEPTMSKVTQDQGPRACQLNLCLVLRHFPRVQQGTVGKPRPWKKALMSLKYNGFWKSWLEWLHVGGNEAFRAGLDRGSFVLKALMPRVP